MTITLTPATHETFMTYAEDAGNWSGNPYVSEGNVACTRETRGNLSDLVKKGLIRIVPPSDIGSYVVFTPLGVEYAAQHGIDLSWI